MKEHITANRIANSIMQRRNRIDNFILVEGSHDRFFFLKFKNENTQIEIAFGWEKVVQVIKELSNQGYDKILGVIDKDLKEIIPEKFEIPDNVILTDTHDINILSIEYSFDFILSIHKSEEKFNKFIESKAITSLKSYIYELLIPLSFLRVLSKRQKINLSFKGKNDSASSLDYSKFIDKSDYEFISLEKMVDTVVNFSRNKVKNEIPSNQSIVRDLKDLILKEKSKYRAEDLLNGHDFGEVVCLGLKKCIGSKQDFDSDSFLKDCILNYESIEFLKTDLYKNIRMVEQRSSQQFLKN